MFNSRITVSSIIILMFSMTGQSQALKDPTRPSNYQTDVVIQDLPDELVDWRVTAIRISNNDRTAIVNGRLVRVGDKIDRAIVRGIRHSQVFLEYDNKQLVVRLYSNVFSMKQPSKVDRPE